MCRIQILNMLNDNFKVGTRILCCDEGGEYCDEHFLKPDGEWENLTNYTPHYISEDVSRKCPWIDVLEEHKIHDKPTELEFIAINTLKNGLSYNILDDDNTISKEIMEHLIKIKDDDDYGSSFYPKDIIFNEFEKKNRDKIGWELFYLANAIAKYRDLGRPEPCPKMGISLGFGINIETDCFLTEAIARTQDKIINIEHNTKYNND